MASCPLAVFFAAASHSTASQRATSPSSPRTPPRGAAPPAFPSPPCSPPEEDEEPDPPPRFSRSARQQDGGRDSYFKNGVGVTLKFTDSEAVRKSRLTHRVFRDVDSLASARAVVDELRKRAREPAPTTDSSSAIVLVRQPADERAHEGAELKRRLSISEGLRRSRDLSRKRAEEKLKEALAAEECAREEAHEYKRRAEAAARDVTAAERAAEKAKALHEQQRQSLRAAADQRAAHVSQQRNARLSLNTEMQEQLDSAHRDFESMKADLSAKLHDAEQRGEQLQAQVLDLEESKIVIAEQLADTSEHLEKMKLELEKGQLLLEKTKEELALLKAKPRGRPRGHRGREDLEERWDELSTRARSTALLRHTSDIVTALQTAGIDDWLPSALVMALKHLQVFGEILSTRDIAEIKYQLVTDLSEVLAAEWGVKLAIFVRTELNLSHSDWLKMRLAFCKTHDSTKDTWTKRVWYHCDILQKTVSMPEPLVSSYAYLPHWKKLVASHGLALSADGTVAERGFASTVSQMIARERDLLVCPRRRKWNVCFGIDGTSVSGKRSFSHGFVTLAPMYKQSRAVLTEMKGRTLCIGQHHDHNEGLITMLHRKSAVPGREGTGVSSIAEEIEEIVRSKKIEVNGECINCDCKGGFDLAAVRGMLATRGKASPICSCSGKEGRQKLPGDDIHVAIPEYGDTLEVWRQAEKILKKGCDYG